MSTGDDSLRAAIKAEAARLESKLDRFKYPPKGRGVTADAARVFARRLRDILAETRQA